MIKTFKEKLDQLKIVAKIAEGEIDKEEGAKKVFATGVYNGLDWALSIMEERERKPKNVQGD
jgi:hypothetical protein